MAARASGALRLWRCGRCRVFVCGAVVAARASEGGAVVAARASGGGAVVGAGFGFGGDGVRWWAVMVARRAMAARISRAGGVDFEGGRVV